MSAQLDISQICEDFKKVASLASISLADSDLKTETLPAPHAAPTKLPELSMAVYVFLYDGKALKVGKVGAKSQARYTSQHYNPSSAPSTLAATLLKRGDEIGVADLSIDTVGPWIKEHTDRINFLLPARLGPDVLSLLESFLHCKLNPLFEGFASQR